MDSHPASLFLYEDESQYFGFFPFSFIDSLTSKSYEVIYTVVDRFITIILASEEANSLSHHQIEEVFRFFSNLSGARKINNAA